MGNNLEKELKEVSTAEGSSYVNYIAMGERMHTLRVSARMTQEKIAELCGISLSFYSNIERGDKIASVDTVAKIADVFSVSIDYLIFGKRLESNEPKNEEILEMIDTLKRMEHRLYLMM